MASAAPYIPQDTDDVSRMLDALELARKEKRRGGFAIKKTSFQVKGSSNGIKIDSWKLQDWDYKRPDLPTYARGLFTTPQTARQRPEIAVRGYDKFFNINEVPETQWENIIAKTIPPYELTLKENGCIIFVSGLDNDRLLVCSKHSTGDRDDIQVSHATAGERRIEKQLSAIGRTKEDLARELRSRNVTAVAELCDDSFEEHVLAYNSDKAGLYLHGINLNLPEFVTYPSTAVQKFADDWGFIKTGFTAMEDVQEVKTFLDDIAQSGSHDGREIEGFVIRCKMSTDPATRPYQDWFFKCKFEEPYLMYRQWRECTKALIAGKPPKFKKHHKITEEYLLYARKRLAADPNLGKLYNQNHGIIALREDFLKFKNINGHEAAFLDDSEPIVMPEVTRNVILCPVATIGCGKTTIALAMSHLLGWGHIQNDNITGKGRPPRFTKAVLDQLEGHSVVFADRNNATKIERKQLITDVKLQHTEAKLVCLNFRHDIESMEKIRSVTRARVLARGDNHQTIHAASDKEKFIGVMDGFIKRFEPCIPYARPDDGFDVVIDLDPVVGSRQNLETTVSRLKQHFPNLIKAIPSSEEYDAAIQTALGYRPDISRRTQARATENDSKKNRRLEYMSVDVVNDKVNRVLEQAFSSAPPHASRFYRQLKQTRRIPNRFHVTLMHRASMNEFPDLWQRYVEVWEAAGGLESQLGECDLLLERVRKFCLRSL
ncbi:RNA ligase, T4 RnlA-like protein [Metarhizium album ARSEF 1941]|uniref:RNA ligase, T4 RnlA-like protein n=1 Tax=Metarhizium album (strain ARSEF 1941) TaxID=1081103 RepID=A0A0B2WRC1_METAS|nr:RNA ligase, T4 RnlA-like protein [Metarhizium album ARSEF 1941]KHN98606.1 RNA ligase, T4 RnlA-like protein [Metarhizium album ARSEF 1941]